MGSWRARALRLWQGRDAVPKSLRGKSSLWEKAALEADEWVRLGARNVRAQSLQNVDFSLASVTGCRTWPPE